MICATKSSVKRRSWLAVAGVLLLSSCAGVVIDPAPEVISAPAPVEDRVAIRRAEATTEREQLRALLISAGRALADDRLTVPASDSAYSWYQQVLAIDETHAEAHWGMLQITERYLQLAEQAFTSGRRGRGELMLQRALSVAATGEQVEAVRSRFKPQPDDSEFLLAIVDLTARSDTIIQRLRALASMAKNEQSRLLIVARTDAEGRWIYQVMREAVDGYRLRGNIELGSVPRIVLLDLGEGSVGENHVGEDFVGEGNVEEKSVKE